ncbi:HAD family phosphatase [Pseudomonas sp. 5FOS]|uniref:HAD family hydrolase n=1 Tax=unclassified Pseudomonas TaxID=196821 RepID=UPI001A9FB6F2|nr:MULTISPECIES: HAD family phosphatase [unclassified Pseudomonas]MCE5991367.1 HAD family phosphatase [Pseudomonas sp. KCA11]UMY62290.1 HAD family phosphatase [Pseudomonas sp. LS.1a]
MTTQAIWFDFGGVLSPSIAELYRVYEGKTGINRQQMEAAMHEVARPLGVQFQAPIELALMTQVEWGQAMSAALRKLYPGIDLSRCDFDNHGEQWFADHEVNPHMFELFHEVKAAGVKAAILTNNTVEWETSWRRMVGLDDVTDGIIDSCKVGLRKPDPRIFALAARELGVDDHGCVLIDDVEENCEAARAAGWQAIHFQDSLEVCDAVRALLYPSR